MSQIAGHRPVHDAGQIYSTKPITALDPSYLGPHVEYVLTADFDIDSGPTVTYQYPSSIEGDHQYVYFTVRLAMFSNNL